MQTTFSDRHAINTCVSRVELISITTSRVTKKEKKESLWSSGVKASNGETGEFLTWLVVSHSPFGSVMGRKKFSPRRGLVVLMVFWYDMSNDSLWYDNGDISSTLYHFWYPMHRLCMTLYDLVRPCTRQSTRMRIQATIAPIIVQYDMISYIPLDVRRSLGNLIS